MERKATDYLEDIAQAIASIRAFTTPVDLNGYLKNEMMRAAVERKLGILGEALAGFQRAFPVHKGKITPVAEISILRRQIARGDATLNDSSVWEILHLYLPQLKREVADLLQEIGAQPRPN